MELELNAVILQQVAKHISYLAIYLITICAALLCTGSFVALAQNKTQLDDIYEIRALSLSPDGRVLAIGGRVNDQPGFWLYDTISSHVDVIETPSNVSYISWSPDGSQIAGDSGDGDATTFQIFDVDSKQLIMSFDQTVSPSTILWNFDSSQVATTDYGTIYIRNAITGSLILRFSLSKTDAFASLSDIDWDTSTNQRMYGLVGFDKKIYVWSSISGDLIQQYDIPFHAERFALSPDFSKLAVGSMDGDGDILILDAFNGEALLTLDGDLDEFPQTLTWSLDGLQLASYGAGYDGGIIRVWDTGTGQQIQTVPVEGFVTSTTLVWISDGNQLIYSAGLGAVKFVQLPNPNKSSDRMITDSKNDEFAE